MLPWQLSEINLSVFKLKIAKTLQLQKLHRNNKSTEQNY